MQKEQLPSDIEPHTIEILRKDKGLVWSLDPSFKNYIEVPLRADSWEHATTSIFVIDFSGYKKTGEVKLLVYNCDIYESVQKEGNDSWTSILYAAQGLKVILKTEILQNGKLVQTMEATEFNTDKPDKSLFEIPDGYQKNDNGQ